MAVPEPGLGPISIPLKVKVKKITEYLIEIIMEDRILGGEMFLNGCLFDKNDGRILERDKTLIECGYQSGDELMFI